MESLNPEFALYSSKNNCARTDTDLFPLSEFSTRAVIFRIPELFNTPGVAGAVL